ncbi:cytochrome P450 [Streptomyces sp. NPDC021093]|uniref:cytochrome P450 n=1 Tax=Streptomyces sp. NPDC021093 TaxID=3365112 RepID=UPI0037B333AF
MPWRADKGLPAARLRTGRGRVGSPGPTAPWTASGQEAPSCASPSPSPSPSPGPGTGPGTRRTAGGAPSRPRAGCHPYQSLLHDAYGPVVRFQLPGAADRVAAEPDQVLGGRAVPDYGDLRRLTHLDMVLKESTRLFPPAPHGARETTEDLALGPYDIPAGTTLFRPFWAIRLNPEHWPEPDRFGPGRFTPQEVAKQPRLAHVPYGIGPRSCAGAGATPSRRARRSHRADLPSVLPREYATSRQPYDARRGWLGRG